MSKCEELPQYSYYNWAGGQHRGLKTQLVARRSKIAGLLQIDTEETQASRIAKDPGGKLRTVVDYIAWRTAWAPVRLVCRVDLVLDEIGGILTRFMMELKNLNERDSTNALYKTLQKIAERDEIFEEEIELLAPSILKCLAEHYPGDRSDFGPGSVEPKCVIEAAKSALMTIDQPVQGRPKGKANYAAKNLARDLIAVYSGHSPARPSRSVVNRKVNAEIISSKEGGNLLRFIECVIEALPADCANKVTKRGSGVASLIRGALSEAR